MLVSPSSHSFAVYVAVNKSLAQQQKPILTFQENWLNGELHPAGPRESNSHTLYSLGIPTYNAPHQRRPLREQNQRAQRITLWNHSNQLQFSSYSHASAMPNFSSLISLLDFGPAGFILSTYLFYHSNYYLSSLENTMYNISISIEHVTLILLTEA